jgi:hypothetical protein
MEPGAMTSWDKKKGDRKIPTHIYEGLTSYVITAGKSLRTRENIRFLGDNSWLLTSPANKSARSLHVVPMKYNKDGKSENKWHWRNQSIINGKSGELLSASLRSKNNIMARDIIARGRVTGNYGLVSGSLRKGVTYISPNIIEHKLPNKDNKLQPAAVVIRNGTKSKYFALNEQITHDQAKAAVEHGDGVFYRADGQTCIGTDDLFRIRDNSRGKQMDIDIKTRQLRYT